MPCHYPLWSSALTPCRSPGTGEAHPIGMEKCVFACMLVRVCGFDGGGGVWGRRQGEGGSGLRDGIGITFPTWREDRLWLERKGAISLSLRPCLSLRLRAAPLDRPGEGGREGGRAARHRAERGLNDMDRWRLPVGLAAWAWRAALGEGEWRGAG